MAHEIKRILRAFSAQAWFIEPRKAEQIVAMLEMRAAAGPRQTPFRAEGSLVPAESRRDIRTARGNIAVISLYGAIMPRAEAVQDVSQAAALIVPFQSAFRRAASDPDVVGIVLDIDSPGGQVDLVPETAAMIRAARRPDRPIVAIANTFAASAAYWIASAAEELVVTPSGEVGSIGVYVLHQDISEALSSSGIQMQFISEGPRKVEGNPFEPLSDEARAALQATVRYFYDLFVADVAKGRHVPESVVRGDPEKTDKHFGGGRTYPAKEAVRLGMADRVATIDEVVANIISRSRNSGKRASSASRRII